MKILIAGDGHSDIHERALALAFERLGHRVETFFWHRYFDSHYKKGPPSLWSRLQARFSIGPSVSRLNREFLAFYDLVRPGLVFLYRPTHLWASTLQDAQGRGTGSYWVSYCNDDPFSSKYPAHYWRHLLASIPRMDLVFAYRRHNLDDFRQHGARKAALLRSWFIPEKDAPLQGERCYDVLFAGHYEPDGRKETLERLSREPIKLKIFGPEWETAVKPSHPLWKTGPFSPVRGRAYARALSSSKIALCFLSKLNRDTYTRRCFEIPATRTFLLCEYSDDLTELFEEDREVVFFRSAEELISKVRFYLKNETARLKIAEGGYHRVLKDQHDVYSRADQILKSCFPSDNYSKPTIEATDGT